MKEKKIIGKIITIVFASLLVVCLFTPLLQFSSSASMGGINVDSVFAKYVTPMQVISAQFAKESDLEKAEANLEAMATTINDIEGLTEEDRNDRIAASEEAAIFYTILFSQKEDLLPTSEAGVYDNMIKSMKLYTYFSIGLLALIAILIITLILRTFFPKKKMFTRSGNILSIVVFAFSVGALFITIPMVLESRFTEGGISASYTITPNPNFLFNGILIGISLLVMILTLTTKGLRKRKEKV